jgi:hypothetical protein
LPSRASNPQLLNTKGKVSHPHALLHRKCRDCFSLWHPPHPFPTPYRIVTRTSWFTFVRTGSEFKAVLFLSNQFTGSPHLSLPMSTTFTDWLTDWMNECKRQKEHKISGWKSKSREKWSARYFILADGIKTGNSVIGSSQDLPDFPSRILVGNRKMKNFGMMT